MLITKLQYPLEEHILLMVVVAKGIPDLPIPLLLFLPVLLSPHPIPVQPGHLLLAHLPCLRALMVSRQPQSLPQSGNRILVAGEMSCNSLVAKTSLVQTVEDLEVALCPDVFRI